MKKVMVSLLLAAVLAVTVSGCGAGDQSGTDTNTEAVMSEIQVEPEVLYDENNVTVSLVRYTDESIFPGFEITVDNQCGQNLTVSTDLISANGVMISAGSGNAVDAQNGEVLEDTIFMNPENLMIAGVAVDEISEVYMEIEFYEPGSIKQVFDPVRVTIPVAQGGEQVASDEGELFFENDLVKLSQVERAGQEGAPEEIYIQVENKTQEDLPLRMTDFMVGGELLDIQPKYSMGFGWARVENYASIFGGQRMVVAVPISPEEAADLTFILDFISGDGEQEVVSLP